jgi:hypothetical protein
MQQYMILVYKLGIVIVIAEYLTVGVVVKAILLLLLYNNIITVCNIIYIYIL